jgi:indolepyruvate ferredoxin oxidoreductase
VINSNVLPTGEMIRNVRLKVLPEPLVANILAFVDKERSVILDAGSLAESLFGEYMLTNMIAVGAAYQAGLLPISETSIEKSIRLSGVSTETNILAFRAGRLAVAQPDRLAELVKRPIRPLADRVEELSLKSSPSLKAKRERLMSGLSIPNPTVTKALEIRVEDLIDYQGTTYAERYLQLVMKVMAAECKIGQPGANNLQISQTVIANLHKVMAYKDEYEVARLLTQTVFRQRARDMFEGSVKLTFNLQPPFLRTFGFVRKVRVGEWVVPFLKVLSSFKFLRGTPADPFGYLSARKTERAILSWYIAILDEVCEKLNACRMEPARILVELPSEIRGYEKVKEQSFKEAQQLASLLLNDFRQPKISALSA